MIPPSAGSLKVDILGMPRTFFIALFVLLSLLFVLPGNSKAQVDVIEGDLIKTAASPDVYIVKFVGSKKFKRLILSPDIFNQYGHLRWENIKIIDASVLAEHTTTDLVRMDIDTKIYRLASAGDRGTKYHLNMTAAEFESDGYDKDAVYTINRFEHDSYCNGEPITFPSAGKPIPEACPGPYGLGISDLDRTDVMQALVFLGVDTARFQINVSRSVLSEQEAANIGNKLEADTQKARTNKIDVLPILMNPPLGGANQPVTPPEDFDIFAVNVSKIVKYAPSVRQWQIWNEPNEASFWSPSPNPDAYALLLQKSYQAIKLANPNAQVLAAGLVGVSNQAVGGFLQELYSQGAKNYFDILALHPYNPPLAPSLYLKDYLLSIKSIMEKNGDLDKKIWITEIGWPTDPAQQGYVSEQTQASYVRELYQVTDALSFVERTMWYRLDDSGPQEGWGIYTFNLVGQKPAAFAYAEITPKP